LPSSAAEISPSEARIAALLGRTVETPFRWRDIVVTGIVMLSLLGVLVHLAGLPFPMMPFCHVCPAF
jgi:hypothetical protein